MKSFNLCISSLQLNIALNSKTCVVVNTLFNQNILHILQINGFLNGFNILNKKQIVVYFKFKNKINVINRIFKFKSSYRHKINAKKWYGSVGLSQFTIISTRSGLLTNKNAVLSNASGFPLLGLI